MKKYDDKCAKLLCFCVVSILSVHTTLGDGYRNPPPTAEGIGKSGVNSVWVDDASAISYNPANLAMQTNASLVVGLTMARTETTYTPPGLPASFESDGDWNYLPNLYYAQPIAEGITLGLGITTPYGQGIAWNASDFAPTVGLTNSPVVSYEASAMVVDITPSVGIKLNDNLSFGVGLDIYYSQLELKTLIDSALVMRPPGTVLDTKGEGDDWGFGANAGLTWLPTEKQRVTLTVKSGVELDYDGDFEVDGVNTGEFKADLKLPNIVGIGYGVELGKSVQVEALLEWLQWSANDSQTVTTGPTTTPFVNNWDDTFTFGLGGSWFATDSLIVRAGYAYLPSPIPDDTISPLLPDSDRQAISVGLGYALGRHIFDVAYTFSIYSDRSNTPSGTYDIDSNLIGMTYSASF